MHRDQTLTTAFDRTYADRKDVPYYRSPVFLLCCRQASAFSMLNKVFENKCFFNGDDAFNMAGFTDCTLLFEKVPIFNCYIEFISGCRTTLELISLWIEVEFIKEEFVDHSRTINALCVILIWYFVRYMLVISGLLTHSVVMATLNVEIYFWNK